MDAKNYLNKTDAKLDSEKLAQYVRYFASAYLVKNVRKIHYISHSFIHYQGSIDFNTVNIQRTKGMYFLILTGNTADIGGYDLERSYYPIQSLCPRECTEKYFPRDSISPYTP